MRDISWNKQGSFFNVDASHDWNQSCARVPVVEILNDKTWRIYYGSKNKQNNGSVSFIDVEAGIPENIIYIHDKPLLERGKLGTFDELGVMPSCILTYNNQRHFYYIGYNVKKTLPYHNGVGLAIGKRESDELNRFSDGPLFEITYKEPFFNASSYVMIDEGKWKMWYLSTTEWIMIDGRAEPRYHIKYAESENGIDWVRNGIIAIDYKDEEEGGIARPVVIKRSGKYFMWYSYRKLVGYKTDSSASYRIGYAESDDGITWIRLDEHAGIDVSEDSWDSEMICYPYLIEWKDKLYMFYNGNNFGETGIGYAIADL